MDEYIKSNQRLWNDWTRLHEKSAFYDVEGFKQGRFRLQSLEKAELGDVSGKSLLHLQCHFGLDTLSWANLGANVTGVDFSEEAIALARSLSEETGVPATFIQSDIYDLPNALSGEFDIVFTSYGVLWWLPDLHRWAQVVAHFLKPGGTFYIAEIHPFAQVFEGDEANDIDGLKLHYPYFGGPEPLKLDVKGSYATDPNTEYRGVEYGWNHTMAEILNSLISAGLLIEFLHEWPFCGWQAFPIMEQREDGWWYLKEGSGLIPLLFSLKANKPPAGNLHGC